MQLKKKKNLMMSRLRVYQTRYPSNMKVRLAYVGEKSLKNQFLPIEHHETAITTRLRLMQWISELRGCYDPTEYILTL